MSLAIRPGKPLRSGFGKGFRKPFTRPTKGAKR